MACSERASKAELMAWLRGRHIEFPPSATVRHLRILHDLEVQRERTANAAVDDDAPALDDQEQNGGVRDNDEERLLDAEIRILQKRRFVADLRREIAAIEAELNVVNVAPIKPPDFRDVKYSVPSFRGGESYDAGKWIRDFEQACDSVHGDDDFRLMCIRRLMEPGSEAELFLKVDRSRTYQEFRTSFLENFSHVHSVSEIIDIMKKTTFSSAKTTIMGYILKMQEIASRANIDEKQMVELIVDGFRDRSANVAVLYPATTIAQLKQLAHRYSQLRDMYSAVPSTSGRGKPGIKPATNASTSDARCFNCSGVGHLSAACPEPKREIGSCFRCGSNQHKLRDCPKPPPANRQQIALVDEFRLGSAVLADEMVELSGGTIPEVNKVSVTFLTASKVQINKTFNSLFDTGSPINLIQRSAVPSHYIPTEKKYFGYRGVGGFPLCTYGIIPVSITFRNRTKTIKVYTVPDHFICHPLLLGRDFLMNFGITLYDHFVANDFNKPKVELHDRNEIKISGELLHCIYNLFESDSDFRSDS